MNKHLTQKHYPEAFYQKLGYLFNSIAKADRRVSPAELTALQQIIREDWINLDESTDRYGSDTAYQIHIIFDFLVEKDFHAESAYIIFSRYFKEHIQLFTEDVIDRIFHSANRMADCLNGRNKSELQALTRLHLLMGKENLIV
jgi:hypothetical protein